MQLIISEAENIYKTGFKLSFNSSTLFLSPAGFLQGYCQYGIKNPGLKAGAYNNSEELWIMHHMQVFYPELHSS